VPSRYLLNHSPSFCALHWHEYIASGTISGMPHNLFAEIPESLPAELSEKLLRASDLRIERIVSRGHASPLNFWYDQAEHEWVLLVQGAARLLVRNETGYVQAIEMKAGDYLHLAAHQRHRVDWTTPDADTIWLAIFYGTEQAIISAAPAAAPKSQFSLIQLFILINIVAVGLASFVWASWAGPYFFLACGIAYAAHRHWLSPGQIVFFTLLLLVIGITLVRVFVA
jgi:cupin 2 domain-containing protein